MAEKIWGRTFNYNAIIGLTEIDSPITDIVNQMAKNYAKQTDEAIYTAVRKIGVNVDKAELEKALRYDRDQYVKGYQDGLRNADIVHGGWAYKCSSEELGGTDATYDFECSACNRLALEESNYCPWCGALMDGDVDESKIET